MVFTFKSIKLIKYCTRPQKELNIKKFLNTVVVLVQKKNKI